MKLLLPIVAVSLLFTNSVESRWVPRPGTTWNYLLAASDSDILSRKEEALTVDLNIKPEMINKLHKQGKKVICYFSGGTLEGHRKDYNDYYNTPGLIPDKRGITRWGEVWLDYRRPEIRPLIKRRMKEAISKKCDAIEVDCLDGYHFEEVTEKWKNPLTKEDSYVFAKWLSQMAHNLGISIGLKNLAGTAARLVNDFDFAVVESCSDSPNLCARFKDFPKHNKAVFTIHYGNYGSFNSQRNRMVKEQKGLGFTCTFNNDENLKHPGYAFNCDTGSKSNTSGSIPKVSNNNNVKKTTKVTTKSKPKTTKAVSSSHHKSHGNGKIYWPKFNNNHRVVRPKVVKKKIIKKKVVKQHRKY